MAEQTRKHEAPRGLMTSVGYLLNRTALQIRGTVVALLRPEDLLPPHLGILSTLNSEGPQTQRALGHLLRIDPTTMVWLIDHLEKKNLLRRGPHPDDRRAYLVELTPAGKKVFERATKRLQELEKEFMTPLSAGEQETLKKLLRKLFQNVTEQSISAKYFEGRSEKAS